MFGAIRRVRVRSWTLRCLLRVESVAVSLLGSAPSCDECTINLNLLEPGASLACPIDFSQLPTPEICRSGVPVLELSSVPPIGSEANLRGEARGVGDDLCILTYICVGGQWWIKPTAGNPFTRPAAGCKFEVDITTGGNDASADEVRALLVPCGIATEVNSLPPLEVVLVSDAETRGVGSCKEE